MKMSMRLLMLLALLIFSSTSQAARLINPVFHHAADEAQTEVMGEEDLCKGVGEDECMLMRRTLEAHIDYLYTQQKNP